MFTITRDGRRALCAYDNYDDDDDSCLFWASVAQSTVLLFHLIFNLIYPEK